jgi:hypothetical protein
MAVAPLREPEILQYVSYKRFEHKLVIQLVKSFFIQSIRASSRAHTALFQLVLVALSLMEKKWL